MKRPVIRYSIIACLLYVAFVLLLVPADRIYAVFKDYISLPLKLYQIEGTLWKGRAGVVQINTERLESVSWDFQPHALLLGRIEIKSAFEKDGGYLNAVIGRRVNGDLYAKNADAKFPASVIEPLLSRIPLGLTGELSITINTMNVSSNIISALDGDIHWRDAGIGQPSNIDVGNFVMVLETTDDGIKGVLNNTDEGPLQVDGLLVLNPDGTYKLTSTFVISDPGRADLKQALRFVGTPGPTGKVSMTRSGTLNLDKYLSSPVQGK